MSNPRVIKLRLLLKGRPIRTYTFDQDLVTLGRDPGSDIFLDNPEISRKHASIMRAPNGYYAAQDMNSSNGTFMNGRKIEREYLAVDDELNLGKYVLMVDYEGNQRRAVGAEGEPGSFREPQLQTEGQVPNLRLVIPEEPVIPGAPVPRAWWTHTATWTALVCGIGLGLALSRGF